MWSERDASGSLVLELERKNSQLEDKISVIEKQLIQLNSNPTVSLPIKQDSNWDLTKVLAASAPLISALAAIIALFIAIRDHYIRFLGESFIDEEKRLNLVIVNIGRRSFSVRKVSIYRSYFYFFRSSVISTVPLNVKLEDGEFHVCNDEELGREFTKEYESLNRVQCCLLRIKVLVFRVEITTSTQKRKTCSIQGFQNYVETYSIDDKNN